MIDTKGIFCFLSWKPSRKYDVLERGFSKRLETKATSFGLLGRKDRRTRIGNLCSCRYGCKLRESKTDKAFTQLNVINILWKQKPADKYFRKARETPHEFVALVIVLRFLLVNKNGVNQERTCALSWQWPFNSNGTSKYPLCDCCHFQVLCQSFHNHKSQRSSNYR